MSLGESYDWRALDAEDGARLSTGTRIALLAPAGECAKGDALTVRVGSTLVAVRVVRVSDWTATRDWVEVVA